MPCRLACRLFPPSSRFVIAPALRALSVAYELGHSARNFFYRQGLLRSLGLPCPVISIGNLTNGGTGKTPFVEFLARHFVSVHRMPTMVLQVCACACACAVCCVRVRTCRVCAAVAVYFHIYVALVYRCGGRHVC